jgi:ribosome-associated translation inhibitor RaiA
MNIRVFAPSQLQLSLQTLTNESVAKLQTFFERIKCTEVTFSEATDKTVEMKVYLLRRVLYAAGHATAYEEALENTLEKMRRQLLIYQKEVAIY